MNETWIYGTIDVYMWVDRMEHFNSMSFHTVILAKIRADI